MRLIDFIMKYYIFRILFLGLLLFGNLQSVRKKQEVKRINSNIKEYVEFLKTQKLSPVDYVMKLFEEYDIVVLVERDHRELTQYFFITELLADKRFIDNVGNILTEVGVSNIRKDIDSLMHTKDLKGKDLKETVLEIYRNLDYFSIWEKYNYFYLLEELYKINNRLPDEKKINLIPYDVAFSWDTVTNSASYEKFINNLYQCRDSILGHNINEKFKQIKSSNSKRKKVLVILNGGHTVAFRDSALRVKYLMKNAIGYVSQKHPGKTAVVLINGTKIYDDPAPAKLLIQNGKWDAAFKSLGNPNLGFDFNNTVFGNDTFDLFHEVEGNKKYKYQDIYNGFIFFHPLNKHQLVCGIPGFVNKDFEDEIIRRFQIESPGKKHTLKGIIAYCNKKRTFKYDHIKQIKKEINQWIKK